jgi:hypothetical protein
VFRLREDNHYFMLESISPEENVGMEVFTVSEKPFVLEEAESSHWKEPPRYELESDDSKE